MRVKEIIKEKGLTSKDVAAKLGMTETGFSLMIGKDGNPPLKRLTALADILGVNISEFFDDSNITTRCPHCGREIRIEVK